MIKKTVLFPGMAASRMSPALSREKKSTPLYAGFIASSANADPSSVNGACRQEALDRIAHPKVKRTLGPALNPNPADILQEPRGDRKYAFEAISGTLAGTFSRQMTFDRGETHNEKDISLDLSIPLISSPILITNGRVFKYDMKAGEPGE